MTVFTIGYEGLDIDAFMSLLTEHGIETIVDVRELPMFAIQRTGLHDGQYDSVVRLQGHRVALKLSIVTTAELATGENHP